MNAHQKTILTIALAILGIWCLILHPNVAILLNWALWVFIGLAVMANIYGIIYCLFDRPLAWEIGDISRWEDPVC